jgi:hypothetical protein
MEIEPISGIGGASAAAPLPAEHVHTAQPPPSQVALDQAEANQLQLTEQLAADGDPLAIVQLAQDQKRLTPIDAELLLPSPAEHPVVHEPGKGDLIDLYD